MTYTDCRKLLVERIEKSLPNITPFDDDCADFIYEYKKCKVVEFTLTGVTRKYIEFNFSEHIMKNLTNVDNICIVIQNEPIFYIISVKDIYDQVNNGLLYDRKNIKIIKDQNQNDNNDIYISITYDTFKQFKGINSHMFKDHQIDIEEIKNKNKMALQYEPLVNKITKQFINKVQASWDDIKSMAWEGLVIAFNTYDEERSQMSFLQFAGFSIRNNILTSLDNELRTVKMSNYAQKKATESGEPVFNSIHIDISTSSKNDERKPKEIKYGMYEDEKFSDGDVYQYLYYRLDSKFSARDCNIFYMTFGLKSFDETKGKDIAKEFGISEGLVSQKLKKIISFIRKDKDLCEVLQNLIK